MHPWHDCYLDERSVERSFPVIVEVPKGSKNKYELDKETGLLRLDRVLFSAVYYPANYGFIPRTFCDDGDPLDALVLGQEPLQPLSLVDARAIGVMRMRDEKGLDDKIIAVLESDNMWGPARNVSDVPSVLIERLQHYFLTYKLVPGQRPVAKIGKVYGRDHALKVVEAAMADYASAFLGE